MLEIELKAEITRRRQLEQENMILRDQLRENCAKQDSDLQEIVVECSTAQLRFESKLLTVSTAHAEADQASQTAI